MSWPESETPPSDELSGAISHYNDSRRAGTRGRFLDQRELSVKKRIAARPMVGAGDVLRAM
jgi:hypothetical protein